MFFVIMELGHFEIAVTVVSKQAPPAPFDPTGCEHLLFLVGCSFNQIFDKSPTQYTALWSTINVCSSAKVTATVDTGIRLIYNIASPTFLFHPISNKYC